jgi:hypothetical protein
MVTIIAQPEANGKAAPVDYDTSELTDEVWLRAVSVWQS